MTARHLYLRACCEASMHLQWTQQAKSLSESTIHFFTAEKKCSYETLGVSENSSIEEINTAYQNLFLKFHPQQNENVSDEEQMKLGWKLGEIAKAYVELAELKAKPVFVPIEPPTLVQHQLILLEQQALKLEQKGMAQLEHLTKSSNSDINNTKVLQKKKSKEDCSVM